MILNPVMMTQGGENISVENIPSSAITAVADSSIYPTGTRWTVELEAEAEEILLLAFYAESLVSSVIKLLGWIAPQEGNGKTVLQYGDYYYWRTTTVSHESGSKELVVTITNTAGDTTKPTLYVVYKKSGS